MYHSWEAASRAETQRGLHAKGAARRQWSLGTGARRALAGAEQAV